MISECRDVSFPRQPSFVHVDLCFPRCLSAKVRTDHDSATLRQRKLRVNSSHAMFGGALQSSALPSRSAGPIIWIMLNHKKRKIGRKPFTSGFFHIRGHIAYPKACYGISSLLQAARCENRHVLCDRLLCPQPNGTTMRQDTLQHIIQTHSNRRQAKLRLKGVKRRVCHPLTGTGIA